jgi:hypothetical protein
LGGDYGDFVVHVDTRVKGRDTWGKGESTMWIKGERDGHFLVPYKLELLMMGWSTGWRLVLWT